MYKFIINFNYILFCFIFSMIKTKHEKIVFLEVLLVLSLEPNVALMCLVLFYALYEDAVRSAA